MAYNYQDSTFKNTTKWQIGEETWIVTGVWSVADDDNGRKARTEALGVRRIEKGQYVGHEMKVSKKILNVQLLVKNASSKRVLL